MAGHGIDQYEIIKNGQIVIDNFKNIWLTDDREKWERNSIKAFQELWKSYNTAKDYSYFKERLVNVMELDFSKSAMDALSEDSIFLTAIKSDLVGKRVFQLVRFLCPESPSFEEFVLYAKFSTCIQEKIQDWMVDRKNNIDAFRQKMNRNAKNIICDFMEFQLKTVFGNKAKEGFEYLRSFFDVSDMTFEDFIKIWKKKELKKKLLSCKLNNQKQEQEIEPNLVSMTDIQAAKMKLKGIEYRFALDKRFGFSPKLFSSSRYVVWISEEKETSCNACKERNGKIYVKDEVKSEFPLHPHCACRLLPLVSIRMGTATSTGIYGLDRNHRNDRKWEAYDNVRKVLPEEEHRKWERIGINEARGHWLFCSDDGLQFVTYDNCDTFYAIE